MLAVVGEVERPTAPASPKDGESPTAGPGGFGEVVSVRDKGRGLRRGAGGWGSGVGIKSGALELTGAGREREDRSEECASIGPVPLLGQNLGENFIASPCK